MNERERLIELITTSDILCDTCGENSPSYCAEALADYLLANGVIVPPCKVGDMAYFVIEDGVIGKKYISPERIVDICTKGFYTSGHKDSDENGDLWLWSEIGKTVFLTEEAEQALKEDCK